jgi:hypothetical protein
MATPTKRFEVEFGVALSSSRQRIMDNWIARLSLYDKLDTPRSGVFSKVDGVDAKTHLYTCNLCSRRARCPVQFKEAIGSAHKRNAHLRNPIHAQHVREFLSHRNQNLNRLSGLLDDWEDAKYFRCPTLDSYVVRYIMSGDASSRNAILRRRKELARSDPLVQLELALWKAACETSPPETIALPMEWTAWYCGGWMSKKADLRRHPLTGVAALVAPFLGLKKMEPGGRGI